MTPVRLYDAAHPVFTHFEYTSRGQFFSRHPLKGTFRSIKIQLRRQDAPKILSNDDEQKFPFLLRGFQKISINFHSSFHIGCLIFMILRPIIHRPGNL